MTVATIILKELGGVLFSSLKDFWELGLFLFLFYFYEISMTTDCEIFISYCEYPDRYRTGKV